MKDLALVAVMVAFIAAVILSVTTDLPQAAMAILADSKEQCFRAIRASGIAFSEKESEVTDTKIDSDDLSDQVVRLEDANHCGSGGCRYELCLGKDGKRAEHVPFGYVAHDLTVMPTITQGMHDISANNASIQLIWSGEHYEVMQ